MRFVPIFVASVVAVTSLAGCLNPKDVDNEVPQTNVPYSYYLSDEFPVDLDHDHTDPTLHEADFQIEFVAHNACTESGEFVSGSTVGGFTDIAFWGDYAFVGKRDGFCILDISEPTAPKFVSHYRGEPAADLEVSPDGKYALLLTQRNTVPTAAQAGSTDPTDNLPRGAIVVDVTDKTDPQFESYYAVPSNGVHTAAVYAMGERTIVSIQTYDWVPPSGLPATGVPQQNAPGTQRIELTELKADPTGTMTLQRLGMFSQPRPTTTPLALHFPHDVYMQQHPITGKTLLYAAYWDAGMIILDISDPTSPTLVSRYDDPAPSKYNAYHDVKVSEELIDGRHITVAGPELEAAVGEAGKFRIFDTTDPAHPVQLSAWGLPGVDGFGGGYQFSPHVFQVIDGRIYLAHNHGGIWVLDISNETLLKDPKVAGYFFPHGDEGNPESWAKSASVWGAYVQNGYIYATEGTQGVHVLQWIGDDTTKMMDESMPHMH
jgi:hypothetical protein